MVVEPVIPDPAPPVNKVTLAGVGLFVVALVVLLIFFVPNAEPKLAPEVTDPAKIYAMKCAICHGAAGEGKGRFPKLVGTSKTAEEIDRLLEMGKGDMPRLDGSPEQRAALVKYVKGLK